MKGIIFGVICFLAGGATGYFVAKRQYRKKLDAEIESITKTQEELKAKREAKEEPQNKENAEEKPNVDDDKDLNGHVDVMTLADEEEENDEGFDPDSDDYCDDYDERARVEFESRFQQYYGTGIPYPITQATYDEKDGTHFKRRMIIYSEEDAAYDADSGEQFENYHELIGDTEYDTLNDENCSDYYGVWYIRNDAEGFDYEIEYGNRALENR